MKEQIKWDSAGINERTAVVDLLGWTTNKGTVSRYGHRIAKTDWEDQNKAVINIFNRAGIVQ